MIMSSEDKHVVRHKLANPKGGMNLVDDGGIIPSAVKDIIAKVAQKIVKI